MGSGGRRGCISWPHGRLMPRCRGSGIAGRGTRYLEMIGQRLASAARWRCGRARWVGEVGAGGNCSRSGVGGGIVRDYGALVEGICGAGAGRKIGEAEWSAGGIFTFRGGGDGDLGDLGVRGDTAEIWSGAAGGGDYRTCVVVDCDLRGCGLDVAGIRDAGVDAGADGDGATGVGDRGAGGGMDL